MESLDFESLVQNQFELSYVIDFGKFLVPFYVSSLVVAKQSAI
jgi:hypothetical protein